MKLRNLRSGRDLSVSVAVAETIPARMKGLLGRERLEAGESLWIRPCNGVHTIGMRFAIDVVFLDAGNVVVAVRANLPPNRLTPLFWKAASVLELPSGTLAASDTRVGDELAVI